MLQAGAELLTMFLEALKKVSDPRLIIVSLLWLATLVVVVVTLSGCGTLNYEPNETTIINKPTEKTNEAPNNEQQR